ncbi:MAG: hypothetical protein C5B50_07740 [Verrucomicrobia bacterium]|nr:MAG: hypothetical protein C5B50_07740 [Verrucomicrobiota bacterium]
MKYWLKSLTLWLAVGAFLGGIVSFALRSDWNQLRRRYFPKHIIETLNSPVRITRFSTNGLITVDGKVLPVPCVSYLVYPKSVYEDILHNGIEIGTNDTLYCLARVDHWDDNDPVTFHLARLDLSSVLTIFNGRILYRCKSGLDPLLYLQAKTPHHEILELERNLLFPNF